MVILHLARYLLCKNNEGNEALDIMGEKQKALCYEMQLPPWMNSEASNTSFQFDDLWFADLLSAPAQSSLELRLAPVQALHDTSYYCSVPLTSVQHC